MSARFPKEYAIAAEELLGIIPSEAADSALMVEINAQEVAEAVKSLEDEAQNYLEQSLDKLDPIPPSGKGPSIQFPPEFAKMLNFEVESTEEVLHSLYSTRSRTQNPFEGRFKLFRSVPGAPAYKRCPAPFHPCRGGGNQHGQDPHLQVVPRLKTP